MNQIQQLEVCKPYEHDSSLLLGPLINWALKSQELDFEQEKHLIWASGVYAFIFLTIVLSDSGAPKIGKECKWSKLNICEFWLRMALPSPSKISSPISTTGNDRAADFRVICNAPVIKIKTKSIAYRANCKEWSFVNTNKPWTWILKCHNQ